ncbi:MAG: response regulator transcription factor [Schleiferiaceae bacterium]|jgi:DNA-binding NarL/FixJ family response regulator|nr:response regulator transcription factor [Schleiferiaceae bacterium]
MIKVMLVEDNQNLARSIREKLDLFEEITLRHTARNGKQALEFVQNNVSPDVVLMDIQMPIMNGIEATQHIKKSHPEVKIVMLTVLDDDESIFKAIMAGANGYLLKDSNPKELYDGITGIISGGAPMSPSIALKALSLLRNPERIKYQDTESFDITKREQEILEQLSTGLSYQKIADNLVISSGTVRKHIENIYGKLQVHNKLEAVTKARENRIIE